MPRPYYRHYWYPQQSERDVLSEDIGGIDHEIIDFLFSFDRIRLASFFDAYEEQFGCSAANYARQAFEAWKTRTKKYNVKTVQKFVKIVPLLLTYEQRYDLLNKLYQNTRRVETHRFTLVLGHSEHQLPQLEELFRHLSTKPAAHQLSSRARSILEWVSNHDCEQARKLMAAVETEHSALLARAALAEIDRLRDAIRALASSAVGTHEIRLPYGTILVEIRHATIGERIGRFLGSC
jgi:hypothetical protein